LGKKYILILTGASDRPAVEKAVRSQNLKNGVLSFKVRAIKNCCGQLPPCLHYKTGLPDGIFSNQYSQFG
jgi:hypothetical protein